MFGEFVWWQGVVEDRLDPLKLGRCRVRILGYHTDNKVAGVGIPTHHLPWATPSQPITSAAMNGIGTTPMGPVEGTWVFGFFRDGKNAQDPVMMSTFGGIPQEVSTPDKGFNDPYGSYPLSSHIDEPDTNRLARGGGALPVPLKDDLIIPSAEDSPSLDRKRKSRTKSVPIADAGNIRTTIPNTDNINLYPPGSEVTGGGDTGVTNPDISDATYEKEAKDAPEGHRWNEPNPRYGGVKDSDTTYLDIIMENPAGSGKPGLTSIYPYNHVRMSESGHVEEWDDTPTAERMHRFHTSGTFEEIQPDGTKVVKVVGDEYEIVLGKKNVSITGTCNVTITGDCRMLYQGDLVQEVKGNYHLNVHKDKLTKISGNEVTEVLADRKVAVSGNCDLTVGYDQIINIGDDRTINVGTDGFKKGSNTIFKTCTVRETITGNTKNPDNSGNLIEVTGGTMSTTVTKNTTLISTAAMDIFSLGDMGISTNANFNHSVAKNSTHTIGNLSDFPDDGNATINVLGSFKHKIGGKTFKEYIGEYHETWDGDKLLFTGADTYNDRHNSGVDFSVLPACNPTRTGDQSCKEVETTGL
jgi:hypothetical protein